MRRHKPEAKRATLNAEQFNTLLRYVQGLELKRIQLQQEYAQLELKRNAYYAEIAKQYNLPPVFASLAFNEDKLQIEVT